MKKILLILVLTLAAALPSQARKANINRSGDTTTIVMNGDTVRVTDGEVKKSISKAINDTLWSEKAENEDDETYNYMALDNDARLKEASMWSSTVKQISISMCFCIMVVVFMSLLFYLLHRRAKYREGYRKQLSSASITGRNSHLQTGATTPRRLAKLCSTTATTATASTTSTSATATTAATLPARHERAYATQYALPRELHGV